MSIAKKRKWNYSLVGSSFALILLVGVLMFTRKLRGSGLPGISRRKAEVILHNYQPLLPYIVAQANHETGKFKSNIFRQGNNMFGMKVPNVRQTYTKGFVQGSEGKFAKFNSTGDSLRDFVLWLEFSHFPHKVRDAAEYVQLLKDKGYFEDTYTNYLTGLKSHL